MDSHFSGVQRLLKNGQKPDSFVSHFEQHFKSTTSRMYLCKHMTFKVVKQLNTVEEMIPFAKPDYNICMEDRLMIIKKIRDKRVTLMKINPEIYRACRHKNNFHLFPPSTDDPVNR